MANAAPAKIIAVMKDSTHGYHGMMADQDFTDLANVVSKGQFEMSKYIDYATKNIKGAAYYNTVCTKCHGMDGKLPKDMEKPVGDLISGNPWEIMHKIMDGQPGETMPAMWAFGPQVATDILTYGVRAVCPDCHEPKPWRQNAAGCERWKTCIDCHKGIAHKRAKKTNRRKPPAVPISRSALSKMLTARANPRIRPDFVPYKFVKFAPTPCKFEAPIILDNNLPLGCLNHIRRMDMFTAKLIPTAILTAMIAIAPGGAAFASSDIENNNASDIENNNASDIENNNASSDIQNNNDGEEITSVMNAPTSLVQAIGAVERQVGGKAFEIDVRKDNGAVAYRIKSVKDGKVLINSVNPTSGKVLKSGYEGLLKNFFDTQDSAKLDKFVRSSVTLAQVIGIAEKHIGGIAVEAGFKDEDENGAAPLAVKVKVAKGKTTHTVLVDVTTSTVVANTDREEANTDGEGANTDREE